jgi:DNA-binding response OmpR family regulator
MGSVKKSRVLYAEKDEYAFSVVSGLLDFADIEVVSAPTLKEAWIKAQTIEFDACLLDLHFDEGDSLELCSRLRTTFPKLPILYYSGSAHENDKLKALQAGANVYLKKPFFNDLYDAILTILSFSKDTEDRRQEIYSVSPNLTYKVTERWDKTIFNKYPESGGEKQKARRKGGFFVPFVYHLLN